MGEERQQVEREPEIARDGQVSDLIGWLVPDWRPISEEVLWAIRIAFVLGILTLIGIPFGVTLWDWRKLLIVPAVIAGGGVWFNRQQQQRELEIAEQRAQDEALQGYLDQMSQLLADKERPLHRAEPGDSLSTVARAQTLAVLRRLDPNRKRNVLQFLHEANLINGTYPSVVVAGADMAYADFGGVELTYANLSDTILTEANLAGAILSRSILNGADLTRATLREASLVEATLSESTVIKAQITTQRGDTTQTESWAQLWPCRLGGADLSDANLSWTLAICGRKR
jgi:uncharacterized protein YjbI with pentapeptide repeats